MTKHSSANLLTHVWHHHSLLAELCITPRYIQPRSGYRILYTAFKNIYQHLARTMFQIFQWGNAATIIQDVVVSSKNHMKFSGLFVIDCMIEVLMDIWFLLVHNLYHCTINQSYVTWYNHGYCICLNRQYWPDTVYFTDIDLIQPQGPFSLTLFIAIQIRWRFRIFSHRY